MLAETNRIGCRYCKKPCSCCTRGANQSVQILVALWIPQKCFNAWAPIVKIFDEYVNGLNIWEILEVFQYGFFGVRLSLTKQQSQNSQSSFYPFPRLDGLTFNRTLRNLRTGLIWVGKRLVKRHFALRCLTLKPWNVMSWWIGEPGYLAHIPNTIHAQIGLFVDL